MPSSVVLGVPQGSILGPLLFLIYIDDITQVNLSAVSRLVLYADDILLYRPISSFEDYHIVQSDIDALANWTTSNSMSFNVSNCKTMIISQKKNHGALRFHSYIEWFILDVVPTFKYLGVLFSSNLSWSDHIQGVCSKACKILVLLYRRYYQYSDSRSLLQLYISLVHPHLDYAAQVWDPHLQKEH